MLITLEDYKDEHEELENWEDRWPNFSRAELRCRGTGKLILNTVSLDRLQALRSEISIPLVISSAGRDPQYNVDIGGGPAHPLGQAFDILIYGEPAFELISLAKKHGFTGIGINQARVVEHKKRFIHLDDLDGTIMGAPRPWLWSYPT